jgi:hypothetical protein
LFLLIKNECEVRHVWRFPDVGIRPAHSEMVFFFPFNFLFLTVMTLSYSPDRPDDVFPREHFGVLAGGYLAGRLNIQAPTAPATLTPAST